MKKYFAPLLLAVVTGCSKGEPPPVVALGDRVYTVDEFLAQPDLRRRIFAVCSNDPGRSGLDPNCINSLSAERIASAGTRIPSIAR